jgi:proline iminopeptidase/L-proline amide hydrolase
LLTAGTVALSPALARAAEASVPPPDRELRIPVQGGSVYVRINGDLSGPRPPIIMVHGGPGGALFQFFPALPLAADRAVILYDQLDSGRSDAPGDPANWTVDRYVSEIEAIRAALGLRRFHLHGHSWGGILVNRYAASRPHGLKSLVLQGAPLSDSRLKAGVEELYAALPDNQGAILLKHPWPGPTDNPEYVQALRAFRRKHIGRTSIRAVGEAYMGDLPLDRGDALAETMTGGTIAGFRGRLKGMEDEPLLARIQVPTLVLFGEFDIVTRSAQQAVTRQLRRGQLVELANAGHMAQFDQPDAWRRALRTFLSAHDG